MKYSEIESAANSPLLLSMAQAARAINVCERTVWTLVNDGELPHIRVGRRVLISWSAIERWIASKESSDRGESRAIDQTGRMQGSDIAERSH